jgi:hypothetical protein
MQPRASTPVSEGQNRMYYVQVSSFCIHFVHELPKALTLTRVRRVRCDEGKPECNRCVSTGRKCDGYLPTDQKSSRSGSRQYSASTSPESLPVLPKQLRVALPRKNDQELRSYRYFLDVTAPAIAGVFEVGSYSSISRLLFGN